jgi:hypothetical protein
MIDEATTATYAEPAPWAGWRPATCYPDACFCESIRPSLVRQPSNAASSLSFALVGVLVLIGTRRRRDGHRARSLFNTQPLYATIFGLASIIVGAGSAFYHASLTFIGQTVDVLGMYLIATFVIVYALARIRKTAASTALLMYGVGNAVLLAGLILVPTARRYAFAVLIFIAIAGEVRARRTYIPRGDVRQFQFAVALLALGFAVWVADISGLVCSPTAWIQGHAVWHAAGAASLWMVYRYYTPGTGEIVHSPESTS